MPILRGLAAGIGFVLGLVALLAGLAIGSTTLISNLVTGHPFDLPTIITIVSCAAAIAAAFGLFWSSREVGGPYGPILDYRQRRRPRRRISGSRV